MAPCPSFECANLAMHVNQAVQASSLIHFWVKVPAAYPVGHTTPPLIAPPGGAASSSSSSSSSRAIEVDATAGPAATAASAGGIVEEPARTSAGATALQSSLMFVSSPPLAASALAAAASAAAADGGAAATAPVPPTPLAAVAAAVGGAGTATAPLLTPLGALEPPLASRPVRDPWEAWNTLRCLTGLNPHVSAVLELTSTLPSESTLAKWLGEPLKAAILPTGIFLPNKKGFPTLSAAHRAFVQQLHLHKVQLLLAGRPRTEAVAHLSGGDPWRAYHQYLHHVLTVGMTTTVTDKDAFESPYYDVLQAPLQPLADNLESQTYETFERDPVKYAQYEEAVRRALVDAPPERETTIVMVVGAGRGPLVRRVLSAADAAGRGVKVYAVEKNPNAVITLRNYQRTTWGDRVTVISSDMRAWTPPELADILVSELLGSFGDNELSPECLDGAQRLLKRDTGISIPSAYTSFLAPVTSSKLWNEVKGYKEHKWFETAYVVKLHNFKPLADPQPVFTFVHPNYAEKIDNRRFATLRFKCDGSALVHGFAGYFDCTLYKDVHISINPPTHSEGMMSWFPIYFPITEPIYCRDGETIEARMWRCVGPSKVWYEWAVTSPTVSAIHNPTGRSYYIGL